MMLKFRCPLCRKDFQIDYTQTTPTVNKKGDSCRLVFCPYCGKKFHVVGGEEK